MSAAQVIPLRRCPNAACGALATETVGGGHYCPRCAEAIRRNCDQIFRAMQDWEADRRRQAMVLVEDQLELPWAAVGVR